jgi:hypothetical protein
MDPFYTQILLAAVTQAFICRPEFCLHFFGSSQIKGIISFGLSELPCQFESPKAKRLVFVYDFHP